ncbi:uncharacterized protein LOC128558246 [Mercenaria mercenaria]|uniref:uncharacterized protein LOC128558246 n=1 Tax=Mercenaria mercenaria TaxID=6596 RepID=UPI00234ED5F8|nr:uncharacterized protein LOC128558246 [Mercenaria mercenaria]
MNVTMDLSEIDRSHRVGKPNQTGGPRPIIVKFISYRARLHMYSARASLKTNGITGTYINEDLTRQRSFAFYTARVLVKRKKLNSCWTSDGVVLVKDNYENIHRVTSSDDLANFEHC